MALVICPDCKRQVSSEAESCPNCGCSIKARYQRSGYYCSNCGRFVGSRTVNESRITGGYQVHTNTPIQPIVVHRQNVSKRICGNCGSEVYYRDLDQEAQNAERYQREQEELEWRQSEREALLAKLKAASPRKYAWWSLLSSKRCRAVLAVSCALSSAVGILIALAGVLGESRGDDRLMMIGLLTLLIGFALTVVLLSMGIVTRWILWRRMQKGSRPR